MNRRGFISLLAGVAGAAALPQWRIPKPVIVLPSDFSTDNLVYKCTERHSAAFPDWRGVFGCAPIKAEGSRIAYDEGVTLMSAAHPQPFYALTPDGLVELDESAIEEITIDLANIPGRVPATMQRLREQAEFLVRAEAIKRRPLWHV